MTKLSILPILPVKTIVFAVSIVIASGFGASAQTVSAPGTMAYGLENLGPVTIQDSALFQLNIPETPKNGYKTVETSIVTVTGYSSTPDQTDGDPHITAAGTVVRWGIVATNALPLGTEIRIPQHFGDQVFVVEDRMNRRYQNRLDVWFPTTEQAVNFGIGQTVMEIIEKI